MLMKSPELAQVESQDIGDFAKVMQGGASLPARSPGGHPPRINLDQDNIKNSLGQLVLTLVKLLHELLERVDCSYAGALRGRLGHKILGLFVVAGLQLPEARLVVAPATRQAITSAPLILGIVMSTSTNVMPRCLGTSGLVRT